MAGLRGNVQFHYIPVHNPITSGGGCRGRRWEEGGMTREIYPNHGLIIDTVIMVEARWRTGDRGVDGTKSVDERVSAISTVDAETDVSKIKISRALHGTDFYTAGQILAVRSTKTKHGAKVGTGRRYPKTTGPKWNSETVQVPENHGTKVELGNTVPTQPRER